MHTPSFSRLFTRLFITVFTFAAFLPANSQAVTVVSSADSFITVHPSLGGAGSTHGSATSLYVISPDAGNPGNPVFTESLVRFDLTAYAGQTVQGPATFSLYVQGSDFSRNVPDRTIGLEDIVGAWNEAIVSANNNSLSQGTLIAQQTVHYLTSADNGYVSWTLPAAYVQGWIDAPASNNGVFVRNLSGGPFNDLQFGSRESANAPQLTFVVPEPGTAMLAGLGLLGTALTRRSRRA